MRLIELIKQDSQSGVIAIYLAVIFGVLLVVTTAYASRLQVSELSQSSQIDRSDQAYYAAEAGIEDALERLSLNPNSTPQTLFPQQFIGSSQPGDMFALIGTNGASNTFSPGLELPESGATDIGQLAWRDRKVYDSSTLFSGTLLKDETVEYDTSSLARTAPGCPNGGVCTNSPSGGPFTDDAPDVGGGTIFQHFGGIDFCWTANNGNPQIELSIIAWLTADKTQIDTSKVVWDPTSAPKTITLNGVNIGNITSVGIAIQPYQHCFYFHGVNPQWRYIFRIKPLFPASKGNSQDPRLANGTLNDFSINFKAQLYDLANSIYPLYIPRDSYLIDVIGQSGDIRRRLVAKKERNGRLISLFDYVIYSGSNASLCKLGVQQTDPFGNPIYNSQNCSVTPVSN